MLEKFLNKDSIIENMNSNYKFYFIYYNNEIAGYFSYKINEDHLYLSKLYLKETFRGKKLTSFIFNYLKKFNMNILLNTCKYNKALNFYLHIGFEIIDEELNDIGNGFFMDDYVLKLKV